MKLKDYAEAIARLAAKNPNAEVVYAADDEGNRYESVHYEPSLGNFDGETFDAARSPKNAMCVN